MAASKCPKCSGAKFEAATINVGDSKYRSTAIQCANCGAVIGLLPDNSQAEKAVAKTLADMEKAIIGAVKKAGK